MLRGPIVAGLIERGHAGFGTVSEGAWNVSFWHKLAPLLGGTFRGRQPRQFGTFLSAPSFYHLVGGGEQRRGYV